MGSITAKALRYGPCVLCNEGITQFYLPPIYEPYLPLLPQPQGIMGRLKLRDMNKWHNRKCRGGNCSTSFYGQPKPHLLQLEAFVRCLVHPRHCRPLAGTHCVYPRKDGQAE